MRFRCAAFLCTPASVAVLLLTCNGGVVAAPDPTPPRVGLTARCYFPGSIVVAWPRFPDATTVQIFQRRDGEETKLAETPADRGFFAARRLARDAVYAYRAVWLDAQGKKVRELGGAVARAGPEMLAGGDFEADSPGTTTRTLAFHRAYGPPRWEIIPGARPGGAGKRILEIDNLGNRDGLHSRLFPVDPRATYRQTGWGRALRGGSASLGRQLLTADLKPAGGRLVAYSYAPVVKETGRGWRFWKQRLKPPQDAAYLQVWALAFNSHSKVWFDDLSLVDERTERLAAFDPAKDPAALAALARNVDEGKNLPRVEALRKKVVALYARLREADYDSLTRYLDDAATLDGLVREANDLRWDLKILSLRKAGAPAE